MEIKEFSEQLFRDKLLDAFKFTIRFLDIHNLQWFVGFGTCIGAVRHQGLIPWDDDIDIFMPRQDYNKLLSLKKSFENTGYGLVTSEIQDYPLPFAKIEDLGTTIWELKERPYITGVFIDVFPMDLSSKKPQEIMKDLKKYNLFLNLYQSSVTSNSLKDIVHYLVHKHFRFAFHGFLSLFTRKRRNYFLKRLQRLDDFNYSVIGDYFVLFSACYVYKYEKEILRQEWFNDYVLMPFEGMEVRVPIGYHEYLSYVYGDYMKLPPEEDRVSRHNVYYINLHKRLSISEIENNYIVE